MQKKTKLTALQQQICWKKATEKPFTGEYWNHFEMGQYHCVNCFQPLFSSEAKFDAGCGWPSFSEALDEQNIKKVIDHRLGMKRLEICCHHCGSHLGHVFDDGPSAEGLRYCVNSASLSFAKSENNKAENENRSS